MTLSDKPLICLISDGSINDGNFETHSSQFLALLQTAVAAHIPLVQLREKRLSARKLFELTRSSIDLAANSNTQILVNDRADIALAAHASGVHLTSRSVSAASIRRSFPSDFVVGVSTHSIEEIRSAATAGADFAFFGPIFDSPGKSPIGSQALKEVIDGSNGFPVLAVGGIDTSNYNEVLGAGAVGFAAIRSLHEPANLEILRSTFDL